MKCSDLQNTVIDAIGADTHAGWNRGLSAIILPLQYHTLLPLWLFRNWEFSL